jgi:lipid II:glycine glycyltransferase (peptidoglycan interpeptide bridge formation enzyme)
MPIEQVTEEKREWWDAFVRAHPRGQFLQSFSWGELKAAFGWEPQRLALVEGETIRAATQVLFRRVPLLSLAYVPRGPLLDWQDEEALDAILAPIAEAGRRRGALFLKVEPHLADAAAAHTQLLALGFQPARTVQPRSTLVLDLSGSEDDILSRMKSKTRYNVRLAGRRGVVVRPSRGPHEVELFYELLLETAQRDRYGIHTLAYYQSFHRLFNETGQGVLLFAERDGEVLAALWAVAFGEEATYLYGASASKGRRDMPTHLLQWEAIRWARAQGCSRYDLWGIPDSVAQGEDRRENLSKKNVRDGLWGVYRFKQGFGGNISRTVGAYDLPYRPWLYRLYRGTLGR